MFISEAFAQAAPAATVGVTDSIFSNLGLVGQLPFFLLIFGVMYFVMIRPQMKRQKEQRAMMDALAKGDEVVTSGGLLGKISKVGETFINLEVTNGIEIQVQRSAVIQILPKGTYGK